MKIDDVFKLIDAGFTKEEILSFEKPEAAAAPETETEQAKEAPEEPKPAETAVDPEQFKTALNGFLDSFKAIADDMKSANIRSSSMPVVNPDSAEDILAKVIGIKE